MHHHQGTAARIETGGSKRFTGEVWIDVMHDARTVPISSMSVTFSPGAHTAWHTHSQGQLLIVTSGYGWVQKRGEPKLQVQVGDTVIIAPDEEHWHGATPHVPFQHLAFQPASASLSTVWLPLLTETEYLNNLPVDDAYEEH